MNDLIFFYFLFDDYVLLLKTDQGITIPKSIMQYDKDADYNTELKNYPQLYLNLLPDQFNMQCIAQFAGEDVLSGKDECHNVDTVKHYVAKVIPEVAAAYIPFLGEQDSMLMAGVDRLPEVTLLEFGDSFIYTYIINQIAEIAGSDYQRTYIPAILSQDGEIKDDENFASDETPPDKKKEEPPAVRVIERTLPEGVTLSNKPTKSETFTQRVPKMISSECELIKEVLLQKNSTYPNTILRPESYLAKNGPPDCLMAVIDYKISEIQRSSPDEAREIAKDLIFDLILLRLFDKV